jgi:hypothetical protein
MINNSEEDNNKGKEDAMMSKPYHCNSLMADALLISSQECFA